MLIINTKHSREEPNIAIKSAKDQFSITGKFVLIMSFLLLNFLVVNGQESNNIHLRGNISITNNGLSLIPAFSLNRPAAIFELSFGGEKLSFDPEMRFALDGQPWSFILWWRYKIVKSDKFNLHVGAHPAYIFGTEMVSDGNGGMVETTVVNRFVAGEIVPSYSFNKNTKLSLMYLPARNLGNGPVAFNQFVALNGSFTQIRISDKLFFNARPQLFYLKMNEKDGYFASGSFLFGKKDFPISIGSIVSKKIVSDIEVDNWIWNISLIYSFNNEFVKRSNPLL
jgi:hypothetical protein